MDADETAIIEEYGSSLEDLTFNSKPLINVLTMLAEENSKYASSVTKLIEERIYKVSQQHKLPSLYLLDSIIKNVGGDYLNLIAQVLVKVFVAVFGKGDEKVRKDLYKLRHTWPQYFSAKVLHDVDVHVNKIDHGWPITAIPPPSPSIHVNPKFLKKAEVNVPQITAPDVIKEDEKIFLLDQQKRLAELQRLQEEQLRLTEQEIQEHQMKRDLILKKQEQERKALLTQQQQLLLSLRLESELEDEEETSLPNSSSQTGGKPVSTKAETTQSSHSSTINRDPRLRHKDQTPSHNNNNKSQQLGRGSEHQVRGIKQASEVLPGTKKRSRSQSPFDGREKKHQRDDDSRPMNRDTKPESVRSGRPRDETRTKRRRSLEDDKSLHEFKREKSDRRGPAENRNFRGRGNNGRGREWNGRTERETKTNVKRNPRGLEGRGPRGRGDKSKLRFKRHNVPEGEHHDPPQFEDTLGEHAPRPRPGEDINMTPQGVVPPPMKPKPLLADHELVSIRSKEPAGIPGNDAEFATIPQELTLEHKSIILNEAKRRLELGLITQDQYIELIDKLAEFYELQRQQEVEDVQQFSDVHPGRQDPPHFPEEHRPPGFENEQMKQNTRGRGRKGPPRKRGPQTDGPRHPHRDGPSRKGPRVEEPWRREGPGMMGGPPRMNRPPMMMENEHRMDVPDSFEGPPRPGRRIRMEEPHLIDERRDMHHVRVGSPRREGSPRMDMPGPPNDNGPWRQGDHERVPPLHDLGSHNQHHMFPEGPHPMDEGHPGPFIPQGREVRDFRGPPMEEHHGGPPRAFEEQFPGEPHHAPEMISFGHGRPMEHFQGHPAGPGHERPHHGPPIQPLQMSGSPIRHGNDTPPNLPDPPTPSRMDKKTVDDLFSRLVHVGIITVTEERVVNTPPRIGTPPNSVTIQPIHPGQTIPGQPPGHLMPVQQPRPLPRPVPTSSSSVVPLPIQGAPVVSKSTSSSLNLLQKMIEKSKVASTKIPEIGLKIHDLRKRHIGIINMLYEGTQCSSCGLRFAGEAAAFYREHLDWHFRRNRREKDGRRIAHKQWYIPLKDWLDYEEITDPEEKAHSSFFDSEKPENDTRVSRTLEGDGSCPVLPGDTEAESKCDVCQEKFEQFWEETNEEWHYKEAVRIGGKTYHDLCYQDAKSTHVEETEPEADTNTSKGNAPQDSQMPKKEDTKSDKTPKPDVKEEQSSVKIKQESKIGEVPSKEDKVSKEELLNEGNLLSKGELLSEGKVLSQGEVLVKLEDPSKEDSEKSTLKIKEEKINKNIDDTGTISVNKDKQTPTADT